MIFKRYSWIKLYRKIILILMDTIIALFTIMLSMLSIEYSNINNFYGLLNYIDIIILYTTIYVLIFYITGIYKRMCRYITIKDVFLCIESSLCANVLFVIILISFINNKNINLNIFIIVFPISCLFSVLIRIMYRIYFIRKSFILKRKIKHTNVMIIGAGEATAAILKEISINNPKYYDVKCIVDDDLSKINKRICNIPIVGVTKDISRICTGYNIELIILSIPSISKNDKNRILEICSKTNCNIKILPEIYSLISNSRLNKLYSEIRDINLEDLLERETVKLTNSMTKQYINNKIILVTGAGGSIGGEICMQIAMYSPKLIIMLDIYENNVYEVEQRLKMKYGNKVNYKVIIGSIRDYNKIERVYKLYNINIVFHAAAHKHVPLMEENIEEAIKNNIMGTYNVAKLAKNYNIDKFIFISTDKAVNPTSIMGVTKRIGEMIIQALNKESKTVFSAVRFGNVLGSNGSVIPLFINQIKNGGPITVTHKDITRYFMTKEEAVQLVLKAGAIAKQGEIFVLNMGDPIKVLDIAKSLIRLSGLKIDKDIKICYTGLRCGEKLYEELLLNSKQIKTNVDKIFIEKIVEIDEKKLFEDIEKLISSVESYDYQIIKNKLKKIVPNYVCDYDNCNIV